MNIGIVTTWYERGAAYVSRAYMEALQNQGNEVYIYARGGDCYAVGDPAWDLYNVTYGKKYEPLNKRYQLLMHFDALYIDMLHFEKWLRNNRIEIIIFNEEHGFRTVERVKKLRYIVGAYIDYYTKESVGHFGLYDFLLCNTKRHFNVFSTHRNCIYIPWGTDLEIFKPQANSKVSQSNDHIVFFHSAGFGGINNRKGTDLVLKAFKKVKGRVKLIIHSQVPASKYGDMAVEMIRNDVRIRFIEKTVPAPGLYHLGDVFIYPSRLEGIGLCVPEALACGLPVITTDSAPMNEFVEDNFNGLLVSVNETIEREDGYYWPQKVVEIDDLVRKMQRYVDDKEMLLSHKLKARESAERKLDWMRNALELSKFLQAILDNSAGTQRKPCLKERFAWRCEAMYVAYLTYARIVARKLFRSS